MDEEGGWKLNELHLCAATGGGILGGMLLGHRPACAVEIEPYRREILMQRQRDGVLPWFPIWDDLATFDGRPWRGIIQVIHAGWPCDDISTAGKMLGIEGPKSGLWKHVARIFGEVGPDYGFLENSPAITVCGLSTVLRDLASLGYDARWCVLGGADAEMDTDGPRWWLLAKAAGKGWPRVLQSDPAISPCEVESPRAANNADSSNIVARIRKHELRCGQPAILGEPDGIPHRVDRLAAIGQAQIPGLVKLAWEVLSQ